MKGDFTGFTLGEFHSSDLGIVRIADGDRYDEALLPDIEDKTVDIPGNDGSYYYGSYYKPREFKINVAFDRINNEQFRKLKRVTSNRKLFELTFDEAPYKTYLVKATNPPEFHYVCFDESKLEYTSENHNGYIPGSINHIKGNSEPEMIYKGEGDLTFTAYNPFGFSKYKTLEEAAEDYDNISEWAETSGIHSAAEHSGYDSYNGGQIKVYNPGDISTPFKLYIPFPIPETFIQLQNYDDCILHLDAIPTPDSSNGGPTGIIVNTKNQLIEAAYKSGDNIIVVPKLIYNQYATIGNFFKIPAGSIGAPFDGVITITGANGNIEIDYDYLYF